MKRIDELQVGDMVDLEADKYADKACHECNWDDCDHPEFHDEYMEVREIERETDGCVCVYFDNFACGFPPDHMVYTSDDWH